MTSDDQWRIWASGDRSRYYGEMLYKRAVGELPEMESAKAAARRVAANINPGDSVLDVGCGAGHYLQSLRKAVPGQFSYEGVDATESYVALAKKAFACDTDAVFKVGDVCALPYEDRCFDIVMCNNLLLHLPSIKPALAELYRVSRRMVLVRTLIGKITYRIQEARGHELNESGEPRNWHFLNIYSQETIKSIMDELSIGRFHIDEDYDFDPARINAENAGYHEGGVKTEVVNRMQVGGHVIHPWSFLTIHR